jgi:hypothetical protein
LTGTATLPAHDNYTNALEPSSFYAGQEIRIQLKATLDPFHDPKTARYPELFNVSAMGSLEVQVFAWKGMKGGDCGLYVTGETPLYKTGEFGMTMVERYEGHVFVGAAHVTFAAPHYNTKFIVCFKHTVPMYTQKSDVTNKWMLFSTTDVSSGIVGQYVFQSQMSKMFYYLPDPSSGQYGIIQLLSQENWNFTYAPSSCGSSNAEDDVMNCGFGDNLKLVPAGEPCTLEHQAFNLPYLGSNWVQNDGTWDRSALHGLRLGSTAGGAGRFGTQYANPLVDTWTSWGTYFPANSEAHIYSHTTTDDTSILSRDAYLLNYPHHAYVYLRLPQTAGGVKYDVCFSSREQRISWLSGNNTLDAVPMWRKVYRCSDTSSCAGNLAGSDGMNGRDFTVEAETVGWTMYDLTPNTWGTIVFNDKAGHLSNEPATSTILVNAPVATEAYPVAPGAASGTNNANYWAPPGGDYFRIVKASRFGESTSMSKGLGLGSFPNTGCWDRSLDDAGTGTAISYPNTPSPQQGGWVSDGAEYPIGSRDLTGDPTIAAPTNDAPAQHQTYATLWVPNVMSRWYVCYRRTCGSGSNCRKNAGMRVLPWHDSLSILSQMIQSVVPVKFLHLERAYTPGYGMGLMAAPLVPYTYGEDEFAYPPAVSWYMNDTREYTYGPLIIEKSNYTEVTKLDSRPWNGVRDWISTGCATAVQNSNFGYRTCSSTATFSCDQQQCTEGSALRLVRSDKPCDWPGFGSSSMQERASATDGGAVECNSLDATVDGVYCQGRRANSEAVSTVAFYITVPEMQSAGSGYRVCYRLQGWNWREVWPTPTTTKPWGDATQPEIARQRGDWVLPNLAQTESTSPSNRGVDNWFLPTKDARASMSLTAVEDRAGMEALFIVTDTRMELSVAPRLPCPGGCDASGDVLRLVKEDQTCDVYPNTIDNNGWDQDKADDHLSLYCPQAGRGVAANSGLFTHTACQNARNTKALCKGFPCTSALASNTDNKMKYATGLGDRYQLSRMLLSTPEIYDDIVPGDTMYYNYGSVVGSIELPIYSSTMSQNRYKVCYKQMGTANWVIFNDTWEVQPNPGLTVSLGFLDTGSFGQTRDLRDGVDLIGGELQQFKLRFPKPVASSTDISVSPSGISGFYAKLVKVTGDENGCLNPAGSTEAAVFGSQTTTYQVDATDLSVIEFYIVTPHEPGQYDLCIQTRMTAEDSMSWWRGRRVDGSSQRVTVHDNGVRYYVTPGNQPTNQGQTIVSFIRCTAPAPPTGPQAVQPLGEPKSCDFLSNQDVFNTNPGADSAKIVAVYEPCSDGKGRRAGFGLSKHVGIGGVVSPAQDSTDDLGPGDGQVDVAELTVTLPAATDDKPTTYKVCMFASFTDFGGGSRKTWVEVAQAINVPGQLMIRDTYTNRLNFHTEKAHVNHWKLDDGARLSPKQLLYSSALPTDAVGEGSTAIGGVSTTFTSDLDISSNEIGFKMESYVLTGDEGSKFSSTNLFKLVKVASPRSRVPASVTEEAEWGKVDSWDRMMDASCFSPGHFSANNIDACLAPETGNGATQCPNLITQGGTGVLLVQAHFTVPLEPGKYIVCYKLNSTTLTSPQPWLLVRSKLAKDAGIQESGFFYSHPSFLEFESAAPVTVDGVTSTTNMTVHDLRVAYNTTAGQIVPLSGWCARVPDEVSGQGVPCMSLNNAIPVDKTDKYPADLVTFVNSSQVCPTPFSGADGMGSSGVHVWWSLLRTLNSSVMVNASDVYPFTLPPAKLSVSGQYKVCVFKAGEADYGAYASQFVTKKGLVYQVFNRGTAETGGGTGLWRDSVTGVPAQLLVTPLLGFNSSVRFIEYQGTDTQALYNDVMVPSEVVTSPVTGTVSRTPLLRSGSTVDFVVRAATASGNEVPSGEYAVDVYRCSSPSSWDALQCPLSNAKDPTAATVPFALKNVNGDCPSDSEATRYGWPMNGLRQFLTSGTVRFSLQYLSACDGGVWGCGVRFAATPTGLPTQIMSHPQWVNVEARNYADSIQVGSSLSNLMEVEPHIEPQEPGCAPMDPTKPCTCSPPGCYVMTCIHKQACSLVIRARFQGPPEYAAAGRVAVRFSKLDYTSLTNDFSPPTALTSLLSGVSAKTRTAWGKGGEVEYTLALPTIKRDTDNRVYAFLNVTWDGDAAGSTSFRDWTRIVVEVVRPEPAQLIPHGVTMRALDVDVPALIRDREPSPRFLAAPGPGAVLAAPGSYIDALVPYELRYSIGSIVGEITPTIGLTGWRMTASFQSLTDTEKNKVLEVLEDSAGVPSAENMETLQAYTSRTFGSTDVSWNPASDASGWYLRFRVLNNIGCSRFTGGCSIDFKFTKGTAVAPSMTVTTPVRVIGTTTKVTTHPADPTDTSSSDTALAWDGIRVRVFAGTPCGTGCFLYDEYHYGNFFGLWLEPHSEQGLATRDGVVFTNGPGAACASEKNKQCLLPTYQPSVLSEGNLWAAEWTIKTNMPCYRCSLSFHTLGGAGPDDYETPGTGTATITLSAGAMSLACNSVDTAVMQISWITDQQTSQTFAVAVTAAKADDLTLSAVWPQWYVMATGDSTNAYGLNKEGATQQLKAAATSFTGLAFTLDSASMQGPPATPVTQTVNFQANGPAYDSSVVGTVAQTTTSYSCKAEITLDPVDPTPAPPVTLNKQVKITSVDRATVLCTGTTVDGCAKWETTTTQMGSSQGGIQANVRFFTSDGASDSTSRNVTVMPVTTALTFVKDVTTNEEVATTTAGDPIQSFLNAATAEQIKPVDSVSRTWTYGYLALKFKRSSVSTGSGEANMIISYDANQAIGNDFPARDARMQLCGSVWNDGAEIVETNNDGSEVCTMLQLWVKPEAVSRKVYFWSETATDVVSAGLPLDASGAPVCAPDAGTALSFQVRTYYELPSVTAAAAHVFIVYDSTIEYTLSIGTGATQQRMAPATMLWMANRTLTAPVVGGTETSDGLLSLVVYGLDAIATAQAARVTAVDLSDTTGQAASITGASSTTQYTFTKATEAYATFSILESVGYDDECQMKRLLMEKPAVGYRKFGAPVPGRAWSYGSVDAAVGLPFPIQTVVQIAGDGRGASADKRAWTFASDNANSPGHSLLSVTKHSWSGCNDGGVMTTHMLLPSDQNEATALRPGSLTSFATTQVTTNQGVGSAWVKFDAPCEACTVRVQLCYMGATGDADCLLAPNEALASDVQPLLSDRTKVSRAFSVKAPSASALQVFQQAVPSFKTGDSLVAFVGQAFSVDLEAVQIFGDWSFRIPTDTDAHVYAESVYDCGPACFTPNFMKYGNGGFLQAPSTDNDLAVRLAVQLRCEAVSDLGLAKLFPIPSTVRLGVTAAAGVKVSFYFTRPCAHCLVAIKYGGLGPMKAEGMIMLREYAQSSTVPGLMAASTSHLAYHVAACASQWAWAGRKPTSAVRKNKVWSVSAWRTDSNSFPVWRGNDRITASTVTDGNSYGGNGHGGEWMMSSPGEKGPNGFVTAAVEGTAVFRMAASRACYKCAVRMSGGGSSLTRNLAVLTDATQIVVIPFPEDEGVAVAKNDSTDASIVSANKAHIYIEAYAADEVGDRAYTASGPTIQAYQPLWSVHTRTVGKLEVAAPGTTTTLNRMVIDANPSKVQPALDADGTEIITTVSDGKPASIAVTNGSLAYNGIPFPMLSNPGDMLPAGTALLEVTGTGSYIPISLSIAPGATGGLPTTLFGEKKPVLFSHTVEATHMAVENAAQLSCQNKLEGEGCSIEVYAVGHRPGSPATTFQLSTVYDGEMAGTVRATPSCTNVDPSLTTLCDMQVDTTMSKFTRGVAKFGVKFVSASSSATAPDCTCQVAFEGPTGLLLNTQTVSLTFTKSTWTPTKFMWTGSPNLNTPTSGRDVTTVINRTVTLALTAVNDQGVSGSAVDWGTTPNFETLLADSMDPVGCFVQTGVTQATTGSSVHIDGYFATTASNGLCTIQASAAATSLPLPLNEDLRATPQVPQMIDVVKIPGTTGVGRARGKVGREFIFSGLSEHTEAGEPAAIADEGARVTLMIKNAAGEICIGDYHTEVTLHEADSPAVSQVVQGGMVTFEIMRAPMARGRDRGGSTRADHPDHPHDRQAAAQAGHAAHGGHHPLTYTATGSATLAVGGSWVPAPLEGLGPLYFIRQAKHLWVETVFYDQEPLVMPNFHYEEAVMLGFQELMAVDMAMAAGQPAPTALSEYAELAMLYRNATAEQSWVRGYPFDLMISVVDKKKMPVYHSEDVGSGVTVELRAVGIPCIDADRKPQTGGSMFIEHTCISSSPACRAMKFTALPACGTGGWKKEGMESGLKGMIPMEAPYTLELTNVRYEGLRYDTEVRFTVSIVSGASPGDLVFLGQMLMQRLHHLCFLGPNGACTPCAPHSDGTQATGGAMVCEMPPSESTLTRVDTLDLAIGIVDEMEKLVKAESTAEISVNGLCEDALTFVGVSGDFITPPKFRAEKGIVRVEGLEFDGACGNFSLSFQALPRPNWKDPFSQVAGLPTIQTPLFTVHPVAGDTPAPPPDAVPPPPIQASFKLKNFGATTPAAVATELTAFADSVNPGEFDKALTAVVKGASSYVTGTTLQRICAIPSDYVGSIPTECQEGGAATADPLTAFYGCACYGFSGNANSAAGGHKAAAEGRRGATQQDLSMAARAQVDIGLVPASGNRFNDNPDAVSDLSNVVKGAISDDLSSASSVLKSQGGTGFAEADANDLGFTSTVKATPAPPGGANTPKPSASPTRSPTPTPPPTLVYG